jgi:hypothetical protein
MICAGMALTAMSLLTAGCSSSFDAADRPGLVRPISGRIRVIQVEPWMNSAIVSFEGRRHTAWWDNYSAFYANGHLMHQLPDVAGGRYHFDGLLTDQDIYLGQVLEGSAAPQFNGVPGHVVQYGVSKQHLPEQTVMTVTPVGGGLKLPKAKPLYHVPNKQRKIPLPTQLGQ